MGRSVMLSNGHMLVGLNDNGLVHDFYYPYVGLDNLTTSRSIHHNIGIWVNEQFSWIDDGSWDIKVDFEEDALISTIIATNTTLGIELSFKDFVDSKYTAFCRYITISNKSGKDAEVRLFLHQAFQISRAGRGDTALYVPNGNYLLDYKGWCSLLIYAQSETGQGFDQFAVGNYGIEDKEGTFRDAEDGNLSNNLVEHGGVDSVIRCSSHLAAGASTTVSYWVVAAESQFDCEAVHQMLLKQGLPKRLDETRQHWRDWLSMTDGKLDKVSPDYKVLTKKSLLVIKAHMDRHGGIIASCDSSTYNYGKDYYCYVWPRDGALTILPLIALGYTQEPKKFFEFCADTMHPHGYMMHKYQPDRAIGSTWHPLLHQHHPELAIQEDETAVVLYALGVYLKVSQDKEFAKKMYSHLVKPAADFMCSYMDQATGLPHASYDLWEEKFGTHTYTASVTIAALEQACYIAEEIGLVEDANNWRQCAKRIKDNFGKLFNEQAGHFRKSITLLADGSLEYDDTLDSSSAYGLLFLDGNLNDAKAKLSFAATEKMLLNSSPSGGIPRYEHDAYFLAKTKHLGNPWLVTTLWQAQYYIKSQNTDKAKTLLEWVANHAGPSGMFPEQVDPETGEPIGVMPLVWSHAAFVETVLLLSGIIS
jgi:GH15 family glucan-1,4-alpha-glucosidase